MGKFRVSGKLADSQVIKKVTARLADFESQMLTQLNSMQNDFDKRLNFVASAPKAVGQPPSPDAQLLAQDVAAVKFDLAEVKDQLTTARGETAHVKRVVLS